MMITLKAALVGTSCIGVLAVGGVTYATVAHPDAGLRSDRSTVPDAKPAAPAPAIPATPQCLPKSGDVRHAAPQPAVPQAGAAPQQAAGAQQAAQQAAEQQAQKVDAAKQAPANLPHSAPAVSQPAVKPPAQAPGTDCVPSELPKGAKPAHPAKPQVPQLPQPKKINCNTVKPAIALGGADEKSIILSRGLGHGTKHVEIITHKSRKLCKVTEKWVGSSGQWLKVERIKVPQRYGLDELRQALQLPAGGAPVSVQGVRGWQTPLGGAVLWYSEDGFAMCVEGSTAYTPQLRDLATKLQQQAQQVR